jgi:hypothetical protein
MLGFPSVLRTLLIVGLVQSRDHQVPCLICLVRHFEIAVRGNQSPRAFFVQSVVCLEAPDDVDKVVHRIALGFGF